MLKKIKVFLQRNASWIDAALAGYFIAVTVVSSTVLRSWLGFLPITDTARDKLVGFLYSPLFLIFLAVLKIFSMWWLRGLSRDFTVLKQRNAELEESLSSLTPSLSLVYESVLESICAKVVGKDNHRVRLSLYVPDKNKENFTLLGRFSDDLELRQTGRLSLPIKDGCIGNAWRVGMCEEPTLSLTESARARRLEREYNIRAAVYEKLRMKTVSIGAYRIMDPMNQPLGVLVIEAKEHGQINFSEFKKILNVELQVLQRLITSTRQYVADPSLAMEAGV